MLPRTQLSLEEAQDLLRGYALRARSLTPLPRGTINSNYRLETSEGPIFLRINEGKSDADVRYEADLIWHLGQRGVPTPSIWRTRRGEPFTRLPDPQGGPHRQVTLMRWVEGDDRTEDQIGPEEARSIGALLGRLHRATETFRRGRAGIYTLSHIGERIARLRAEPRVPDGTVEYLQREAERLRARRASGLPTWVGHSDLFPDNVLFSRCARRRHEVAWILDLEQAATIPLIYDVAVALLSFCAPASRLPSPGPGPGEDGPAVSDAHRGPMLAERAAALLAGYNEVRPLTSAEREGLYEELRFAALRFTVTRLTDVHLRRQPGPGPSASSAGEEGAHSKDYREFLRRLELLEEMEPAALLR
jgi:homoserine kinase type II